MPNFTCADLLAVQQSAPEVWGQDRQFAVDNAVNIETARAILAEQTARMTIIQDPDVDVDLKVHWVKSCNEAPIDCTGDDCDVTPTNDTSAECETYTIGQCKELSFGFLDQRFDGNKVGFMELVAMQLKRTKLKLDEEIAKYIVAQVDSYAGVSTFVPAGWGAAVGNVQPVPSAFASPAMYASLARTAIMNNYQDPFILDGGLMFEHNYMARLKAGEGTNPTSTIRTYDDLFNINAVTGAQRMYLIDRGAVAVANKHKHPTVPKEYSNGANIIKFAVPSDNLIKPDGTPFMYDVVYKTVCVGEDIQHNWKVKAKYDTFLNPTGCDANNTGVLAYECA